MTLMWIKRQKYPENFYSYFDQFHHRYDINLLKYVMGDDPIDYIKNNPTGVNDVISYIGIIDCKYRVISIECFDNDRLSRSNLPTFVKKPDMTFDIMEKYFIDMMSMGSIGKIYNIQSSSVRYIIKRFMTALGRMTLPRCILEIDDYNRTII